MTVKEDKGPTRSYGGGGRLRALVRLNTRFWTRNERREILRRPGPGSPAAKAGFKAGDVLVSLETSRSITCTTSPTRFAVAKSVDVVKVKVMREGKPVTDPRETRTAEVNLRFPAFHLDYPSRQQTPMLSSRAERPRAFSGPLFLRAGRTRSRGTCCSSRAANVPAAKSRSLDSAAHRIPSKAGGMRAWRGPRSG